jgi:hypothetical protein
MSTLAEELEAEELRLQHQASLLPKRARKSWLKRARARARERRAAGVSDGELFLCEGQGVSESSEESSDAESSDAESSDAEGSDAESSDAEGSDAESSDTEGSDAGGSDTESGDTKRRRGVRDVSRAERPEETSAESRRASLLRSDVVDLTQNDDEGDEN